MNEMVGRGILNDRRGLRYRVRRKGHGHGKKLADLFLVLWISALSHGGALVMYGTRRRRQRWQTLESNDLFQTTPAFSRYWPFVDWRDKCYKTQFHELLRP